MIDYGSQKREDKGLGDPIGVKQHKRPVTSSIHKWVHAVLKDPKKEKLLRKMISMCNPEDLNTLGYPVDSIYEPLENPPEKPPESPGKKKKRGWDAFRIERKALHLVRRNIHHNWVGKIVKKIRFACDVLLR